MERYVCSAKNYLEWIETMPSGIAAAGASAPTQTVSLNQ